MKRRLPPFSLAGLVAAGMLISAPVLAAGSSADANADGQIDQSELQRSLSTSMQLMDTDGDGQISQNEFDAATGGALDFANFDTNGDGQIDEQEMRLAVFAEYGQEGSTSLSAADYARFEQDFQLDSQTSSSSSLGSDDSAASGSDTGEYDLNTGEYDTTGSADLSTTGEMDTGEGDFSGTTSENTGITSSTTGDGSSFGSLAGYTADELLGADVIGADGESIAEVSDLVLDRDNQVSHLIVESGGFLGMGGKSVALPASSIQVSQQNDGDGVALRTSYGEADIEAMADYEPMEGDDSRLYSSERAGTTLDE